jgi:hypothetical protein
VDAGRSGKACRRWLHIAAKAIMDTLIGHALHLGMTIFRRRAIDADALFDLPSAASVLRQRFGLHPSVTGSICFRSTVIGRHADLARNICTRRARESVTAV